MTTALAKVYNFSDKIIKKSPSKPILKNKPIRFSEMSESARRQSIEAMKNDD